MWKLNRGGMNNNNSLFSVCFLFVSGCLFWNGDRSFYIDIKIIVVLFIDGGNATPMPTWTSSDG